MSTVPHLMPRSDLVPLRPTGYQLPPFSSIELRQLEFGHTGVPAPFGTTWLPPSREALRRTAVALAKAGRAEDLREFFRLKPEAHTLDSHPLRAEDRG